MSSSFSMMHRLMLLWDPEVFSRVKADQSEEQIAQYFIEELKLDVRPVSSHSAALKKKDALEAALEAAKSEGSRDVDELRHRLETLSRQLDGAVDDDDAPLHLPSEAEQLGQKLVKCRGDLMTTIQLGQSEESSNIPLENLRMLIYNTNVTNDDGVSAAGTKQEGFVDAAKVHQALQADGFDLNRLGFLSKGNMKEDLPPSRGGYWRVFCLSLLALSTWDLRRTVLLRQLQLQFEDKRRMDNNNDSDKGKEEGRKEVVARAIVDAIISYFYFLPNSNSTSLSASSSSSSSWSISPAAPSASAQQASILLSQLMRGQSGVIKKSDPSQYPIAQSFRVAIAKAFVDLIHNYLFCRGDGASSSSSVAADILTHDFLLHEVFYGVLGQTGYEWIWPTWCQLLETQGVNAAPLLSTNKEAGGLSSSTTPLPSDARASISPIRTIRDLILTQLHGGTSFVERINASIPSQLRLLIGKMPKLLPYTSNDDHRSADGAGLWRTVVSPADNAAHTVSSSSLTALFDGNEEVAKEENMTKLLTSVKKIAESFRRTPMKNKEEVEMALDRQNVGDISALPCILSQGTKAAPMRKKISGLALVAAIFVVTRGGNQSALLNHLLVLSADILKSAAEQFQISKSLLGGSSSTSNGTAAGAGHSTSFWVEGVRLALFLDRTIVSSLLGHDETLAISEVIGRAELGSSVQGKMIVLWPLTNVLVSTFLLRVYAQSIGSSARVKNYSTTTTPTADSSSSTFAQQPYQQLPLLGVISVDDMLLFFRQNLCCSPSSAATSPLLPVGYHARHFCLNLLRALEVAIAQQRGGGESSSTEQQEDEALVMLSNPKLSVLMTEESALISVFELSSNNLWGQEGPLSQQEQNAARTWSQFCLEILERRKRKGQAR